MKKINLILSSKVILALGSTLIYSTVLASNAIHLEQQSFSSLKPFIDSQNLQNDPVKLKQTKTYIDFNNVLHVRAQQTYSGYPVYGADIIVHIPNGPSLIAQDNILAHVTDTKNVSMDGTVYDNLKKDLAKPTSTLFNTNQAELALQHAVSLYQQSNGNLKYSDGKSNLIVFIDDNNEAHWAYLVSFEVKKIGKIPEQPTYILDAKQLNIYKHWDDIKTLDKTSGGGFGGNPLMGKHVFDGLATHSPSMAMSRDPATQTCYLKNNDVTVKNMNDNNQVSKFTCANMDPDHNNIYWNAEHNQANGGYSPDNDALYAGRIIKDLYQQWYNIPVLVKNDKPMMLTMRVHDDDDNAYWDGKQMTFGDGITLFYPLVSLGIAAHEISHGFTEQHSQLAYYGQSGGLNESFSDMAAQAAEYYADNKNSWLIGSEIIKNPKALGCQDEQDCALRYMNNPPKDGNSIDHINKYNNNTDVHHSSGIFNKVFYLLANKSDWNIRKAFDVMVKANMHYWTSITTFQKAGCGVIKAAKDYQYNLAGLNEALVDVGLEPDQCK